MKKQILKSAVCCLLLAIMVFSLAGCSSPKNAIVGKWVGSFETYTFYDDHTLKYSDSGDSSTPGTYSIVNDQLELFENGKTAPVNVFHYKIEGNELTLTREDGAQFKFKKEK